MASLYPLMGSLIYMCEKYIMVKSVVKYLIIYVVAIALYADSFLILSFTIPLLYIIKKIDLDIVVLVSNYLLLFAD
jgi:hypothetical protein